ncbi:MAG: prepilin peptidase [Burkholderiales bacterium]|nr:prepilin peptidase [Burkholderiales bacterium]
MTASWLLLAGLMAFAAAPPQRAAVLGVLGLSLLAAALIDAKTLKLPDVLIVMIGVAGAILAASRSMTQLAQGVIVAIFAFALLQGVRWAFRVRRGHDGLGFGDVLLIAALGLWLGAATAWAVALAGAIGLLGIAIVRPAGRRVAFGPSIALGAWTVGLLMEAGIWPLV